jgi:chaperonin GroES
LTEASIKFGDKATLELLRPENLVSCGTIGKDKTGEKKVICEAVSEAMNYQINHAMPDWRPDQERLYYTLPNVGTVFKKVVHDAVEEQCEATVINYPDFVVNQATKSMEKCRSFSHVLDMSKNDVEVRVRCGKWLELEMKGGEEQDGDQGSNEQQKVESAIDNQDKFIEQQTYIDLDDDDYEEPYTVTYHEKTGQVVRIVARFDESSIIVKYDNQIMPLPEAMEKESLKEKQQFGGDGILALLGIKQPKVEEDDFELLKIVPFQNVVKYGFIPAPDGTFLDYGYSHLLGAITQAINAGTNQLVDRATLNNIGGGFLSKEFRKEMGINRLRMGQYIKTDVPADKFANGIYTHPVQEPSQTLYAMVKDLLVRGAEFLAITDISGKINAQTAPTTALAIVQEAIIPTSALFKRVLDAQSREFKVLHRINSRTFSPELYQMILDEQRDPVADFSTKSLDVYPTANAEMSNKMHRIQTVTLELEQMPNVLQAGGNPIAILRNYFEVIGSTIIDEVFPEDGAMPPADKARIEAMTEAQNKANQIAEMQLNLLSREQDRLDRDTAGKLEKYAAEVKEINANIIKIIADASLAGEKAETESLNNQVNQYTARLQVITELLSALGADTHARPTNVQTLPIGGNLQGSVPRLEAPPRYAMPAQ